MDKALEDKLRDHVASMGDKDFWLSRKDAAVVCGAIRLSLPVLSWQGIKAGLCAHLCRFSRGGDRWMSIVDPESDALFMPVSIAALEYLKANGSTAMFDDVRADAEATKPFRKGHASEALEMVVSSLYNTLTAGMGADALRARVRRIDETRLIKGRDRQSLDALGQEQRRFLDE